MVGRIIDSFGAFAGAPAGQWLPTDLSSLRAWYDAGDETTITDTVGDVTQWNDKSGNGFHVYKPSGNQPRTGDRSTNSLNVLDVGAVEYILDASASVLTSTNPDLLIAGVVRFDANQGTNDRWVTLGDTAGNDNAALSGGSDGLSWRFNGGAEIYGSTTLNSWLLMVGVRPSGGNHAASQLFVDGSEQSATSDSNPTDTPAINAGITIGVGWSAAGGEIEFDGAIAEIVIAETTAAADRQKVEGYLAHRWGLSGSLPSGHPYKSAAP